jgi:hypothetical protein
VALKLQVKREGLYRVSYEALQQAGVPPAGLTAQSIGLCCGGEPVARRVVRPASGAFGPGAAIVFYGRPLDTRWTDTNVYWLTWDGTNVLDMKPLQASLTAAPEITSFPCRLHFEENHQYVHLI